MSVENPQKDINEGELITSVELHVVDSTISTSKLLYAFRDKDGDGGQGPTVFDTIRLQQNRTYFVEVILLDESGQPVDTISNEVKEEAADHLLCYDVKGVDMSVEVTDSDGTLPLGLESTWRTTNVDSGTINISLKHQPSIKTGACNLGESDVDLNFVLEVSQ
jgi:hypothetical protein